MNRSMIVATLICLAPACATATGQKPDGGDGPVGIFASDSEYDSFMRGAKELAYGPEGTPEMRAIIPMLNDIALNQPIGSTSARFGGPAGTLDLLADKSVREELEMMDDQYADLQRMNEEVQKRAGDQLRALDFSDRENLVRQIRNIREQAESDLNSVLLPHQLERLRQLRSQTRLRGRSFVDVITSEPIRSDIDLSDQQARELREEEQRLEEELQREIARLREKTREELMSRLNRTQREQVEQIFGTPFEFSRRAKPGTNRRAGDK